MPVETGSPLRIDHRQTTPHPASQRLVTSRRSHEITPSPREKINRCGVAASPAAARGFALFPRVARRALLVLFRAPPGSVSFAVGRARVAATRCSCPRSAHPAPGRCPAHALRFARGRARFIFAVVRLAGYAGKVSSCRLRVPALFPPPGRPPFPSRQVAAWAAEARPRAGRGRTCRKKQQRRTAPRVRESLASPAKASDCV